LASSWSRKAAVVQANALGKLRAATTGEAQAIRGLAEFVQTTTLAIHAPQASLFGSRSATPRHTLLIHFKKKSRTHPQKEIWFGIGSANTHQQSPALKKRCASLT